MTEQEFQQAVLSRLDSIDGRMDAIDRRLDRVESDILTIKDSLNTIRREGLDMRATVDGFRADMRQSPVPAE